MIGICVVILTATAYLWRSRHHAMKNKHQRLLLDQVNVRSCTVSDLEKIVKFPEREGWNPGLAEYPNLIELVGADSILVGDLNGAIIATLAVIPHGKNHGWIGLYICAQEYRGQGIGLKLWKHGEKRLAELGIRNVGLDGVVAQQENYKKSGFVHAPYYNVRHAIQCAKLVRTIQEKFQKEPSLYTIQQLKSGDQNSISEILEFDKAVFPEIDRAAFLQKWLNMGLLSERSKVFIALEEGEGKKKKCVGFGMIRPGTDAYRIAPLQAKHNQIAIEIISKLLVDPLKEKSTNIIHIDVPETNEKASNLMKSLGLDPIFPCLRMYKGPSAPVHHVDQEYAITTWELSF